MSVANQGLACQGKVFGTVDLIGSQRVSMDDLEKNVEKHQIEDLSLITYKKIFVWEVSNAKRFAEPLRHLPKKSCQVWMSVEYPCLAEKVQSLMEKASKLENDEELLEVAKEAGISSLKRGKGNYWRVLCKDFDISEKFPYSLQNKESLKAALLKAFAFQHSLALHQDDVACMQVFELRECVATHGIATTKTSADALRKAVLHHFVQDVLAHHCPKPDQSKKKSLDECPEDGTDAQKGDDGDGNGVAEPPNAKKAKLTGTMVCKFFDRSPEISCWVFSYCNRTVTVQYCIF